MSKKFKYIFGFTKLEAFATFAILLTIGLAIYMNLQISLQRGRDIQRKNDIKAIHDALIQFHIDEASFPQSREGKIVSCLGGYDEGGIPQFAPCEWHTDAFANIFTGAVYIPNLPTDPTHNEGARYHYISNGRNFQIYAALEGRDEAEFDAAIEARGLMCGNKICNFGRGFGATPLDKSLEEYENELRE